VVASTADKQNLNRRQWLDCWDGVTDYRITRFFGGSNSADFFISRDAEDVGEWIERDEKFRKFSQPKIARERNRSYRLTPAL
jgi:hypothetical protein